MIRTLIVSAFVLLILLLPDYTYAQSGFVTCSGTECSACNLVEMANDGIVALFGVIGIIFAILMTVAGFGLVTSGGNQSALEGAKSKFTNAIIGLIIVMSAWLMVDTIMRNLVEGDGNLGATFAGWGPWSEVTCLAQTATEVGEIPESGGNPPDPNVDAVCTDDAALMAKYRGSPIGREAPGLVEMIACYRADPAVSALLDTNQIYTVDRSYPRCSLTNGHTACGPCSHSANSNHYGRGSGLGAKAVDFNSKGSERALYDALVARKAACGGTLLFETNHTHISM